jgi:crotonobetainyl-CoA:carnitine CoA-transferase CaiB-like acyl-CoA transferase
VLAGAAPLAGVRVLELADGRSDLCGRYLADLGADVVLVESPHGSPGRARPLYFQTHDANKRSVALDLTTEDGRAGFRELATVADIVIETTRPGTLAGLGLSVGELRALNPSLVVVSITDYGQTGPYRDFVATNDTHIALGGVLCRSGLPGKPPLLPPGELAFEASAVQAAWCALLAYQNAQATGRGDHLDFSIYEATAQIIDPGLGTIGSGAIAAGGTMTTRGRPVASHLYPIFRCADGYVRICVLSPRQWRGMLTWLGDPVELSDDDLVATANRFGRWDLVSPFIAALFRDEPAAELVAAGQLLGVPIAALRSPADVLRTEHFHERGAFVSIDGPDGRPGTMPSGFVEVGGARAGYRRPAPVLGDSSPEQLTVDWPRRTVATEAEPLPERIAPLAGLRVLDLGVIVAGAEGGRLFADQGADVIKIESREFPDGSRLSATGAVMSAQPRHRSAITPRA